MDSAGPIPRLEVRWTSDSSHDFFTTQAPHDITEAESDKENVQVLASRMLQYRVGVALHTWYLPVVVVVGLLGNTLSLAVMLQRHNRRISCCLYMAALACTDNLFLICGGYYWMATDGYPRPLLLEECNFIVYCSHIGAIFGVLTIVAMTVDRFLAVRFPLRAASWCSPRRARFTIAGLLIFSCLYNIPYLLSTKVLNKGRVCAALRSKNIFTQVYSWLSICLNSVIPFTILMILNVFIIKTIKGRHKYFKKETSPPEVTEKSSHDDGVQQTGDRSASTKSMKSQEVDQSNEDKAMERQLTFMLMLVTFALLVLTLPQYVRFTVYILIENNTSAERYANYMLAYHVSNKLFHTNNAVNFFMYCMGGSKFRQDLVCLLTCASCGKVEVTVSSSTRSLNTQA